MNPFSFTVSNLSELITWFLSTHQNGRNNFSAKKVLTPDLSQKIITLNDLTGRNAIQFINSLGLSQNSTLKEAQLKVNAKLNLTRKEEKEFYSIQVLQEIITIILEKQHLIVAKLANAEFTEKKEKVYLVDNNLATPLNPHQVVSAFGASDQFLGLGIVNQDGIGIRFLFTGTSYANVTYVVANDPKVNQRVNTWERMNLMSTLYWHPQLLSRLKITLNPDYAIKWELFYVDHRTNSQKKLGSGVVVREASSTIFFPETGLLKKGIYTLETTLIQNKDFKKKDFRIEVPVWDQELNFNF